jgi:CheY-like chemotaxis protein
MASPPQPHTHTILLIEDDAGTRDATRALLVAHEYAVVSARNGDDALTLVGGELRPCVIVLDLMMSGTSGDEFRRAQLADRTVRDIPVILVSGVRDLAERAYALGVAAYLSKPLDTDQLVGAIAQHCGAAIAVT